jgi:hypothetical protein
MVMLEVGFFFWLVVAPPQPMQFDRVELGSQQAQVPNISSFAFLTNLLQCCSR